MTTRASADSACPAVALCPPAQPRPGPHRSRRDGIVDASTQAAPDFEPLRRAGRSGGARGRSDQGWSQRPATETRRNRMCVSMWPLDSHGGGPARVDFEANGTTSDRGGSALHEADDAPLPLGYSSDRLELLVRDPTSARAYWDLSNDRINVAVRPHVGGRAFLPLMGVPSGYLLAECGVPIARGSQDVALPEAGSSYKVELAVMRDYRSVVLARSRVIHGPPKTPRVATTPAVVSRAQEPRVLFEGPDREFDSDRSHVVGAPTERAPHGGPAGRVVGPCRWGPRHDWSGSTRGSGSPPSCAPLNVVLRLDLYDASRRTCPSSSLGVLDFQRRWPSRSVRWLRLSGLDAIQLMCSAPETCWSARSPTRGSRPNRRLRSSILRDRASPRPSQPVQMRPDRAVRRTR